MTGSLSPLAAIPLISAKWHEIAYHLLQDAEYRTKLVNAYEATADYYDTTYRSPQDWSLASPDGLVDLYSFASQVAAQFGRHANRRPTLYKLARQKAPT